MATYGHENHRARVRKRFVDEMGFDSFNDHQVLEMLLFLCLPRCDTNEIAHALLDRFGSFSSVLEKSKDELQQVEGIGENAAINITMITELCRRYYIDRTKTDLLMDSSEKIAEYILPKYIGVSDELVYCICMDNTCRVTCCERLARGDAGTAFVSVRKVVECAIRNNAANIIVSHNHPNGLVLPSHDDITTTQDIITALKPFDIKLVDHFIIARADWLSLRQGKYI